MMHPRTDFLTAMRNNGGSHSYTLYLTNVSKMLSSSSASHHQSSALHHKNIIMLRYKEFMLPIMKFHIIFIPVGNEAI